VGAAVMNLWPFIPEAYAIAPLAVAAVVQTAISIAGLFSNGGDGIASLLHLQVEMLNHIEGELGVIEQQIKTILENLDKLAEKLQQLPKETVLEQNRAAIGGLSLKYIEVRDTYLGLNREVTPELEEDIKHNLIGPLQAARDIIMSYPDPPVILVPTICTACFVESWAMALVNTSKTQSVATKQALKAYRKWFLRASTSLESNIVTVQKQQFADYKTAREEETHPATKLCFIDGDPKTRSGSLGPGRGIGQVWWKKCISDKISTTVKPISDSKTAEAARQMVAQKILLRSEEPYEVSVSFAQVGPAREQTYEAPNSWEDRKPIGVDQCPNGGPNGGDGNKLPRKFIEDEATGIAAELTQRLTSNGLNLMTLHALKHAAGRGIAFIEALEPSLKEGAGH